MLCATVVWNTMSTAGIPSNEYERRFSHWNLMVCPTITSLWRNDCGASVLSKLSHHTSLQIATIGSSHRLKIKNVKSLRQARTWAKCGTTFLNITRQNNLWYLLMLHIFFLIMFFIYFNCDFFILIANFLPKLCHRKEKKWSNGRAVLEEF